MLDPVAEFNPFDDFGQAVLTVELAPFLLGGQHQLMCHRQCRLAAEAAFGLGGSVADGGKGAFDRVAGPDVLPVFGREVVECEQIGTPKFDSKSRKIASCDFSCPYFSMSYCTERSRSGGFLL